MRKEKDHLEVVLDYDDGHIQVVEVDILLDSIGRDANTKGLGLENVAIQPNVKGYLHINEECAISDFHNYNIFAAGDVTGQKALYGVAEEQGRIGFSFYCIHRLSDQFRYQTARSIAKHSSTS